MVLISCTTTNERIEKLFYTLESLKYQSRQPDKIFINLSSEPYLKDSGIKKVPDWLSKNEKIVVNLVENTGSYRKLVPTLDMINDNDAIITIDDDVIYHKYWLEKLILASEKNTSCIVCGKARKIKKNIFNKWQSYSKWNYVETEQTGFNLLPIGCSGILYRKNLVDNHFIVDKNFLALAPTCDDLWFRIASMRMGVKVYVDPSIDHGNIYMQHADGLDDINLKKPSSNFFSRLYHYFAKNYLAYLGLYSSQNDFTWQKINKYCANKKISQFG